MLRKFGSAFLLGTEFPPCDGRWHRTIVTVAAEKGVFVAGRATVTASIAAYDPIEDADVDAGRCRDRQAEVAPYRAPSRF